MAIIQLGLGMPEMRSNSFVLSALILPVLEALVMADRIYLRSHPGTPMLYRSGVRYEEEPEYRDQRTGELIERFDDIPTCLSRGWGDCDDLAPWRVAELNERGIKATLAVTWKRIPSIGRLFHVQVRWPDGIIEDPSARLGMPGARIDYSYLAGHPSMLF